MHQITQLQRKVNSVAKSCVTPEQKASARRFYHLYKAKLKLYNEDFGYQVKVDMIMLTLISLIIAMGAGLTVLYFISKMDPFFDWLDSINPGKATAAIMMVVAFIILGGMIVKSARKSW